MTPPSTNTASSIALPSIPVVKGARCTIACTHRGRGRSEKGSFQKHGNFFIQKFMKLSTGHEKIQ